MSLLFADNTTNNVDHGSAASLDNISEGTIGLLVNPTTVANAPRMITNKTLAGAPNGWYILKTASDGTNWRLVINRATSDQNVIVPGVVADLWQFLLFTWSIAAGGPKGYRGTLHTPIVDVSSSPTDGSGAKVDDSGSTLRYGERAGADTATGARLAWSGLWDRILTQGQMWETQNLVKSIVASPGEPVVPVHRIQPGIRQFSFYGRQGGRVIDYSPYSNHGTVTGAVFAESLVNVEPRRRRVLRVPAVAGGFIANRPLVINQAPNRAATY